MRGSEQLRLTNALLTLLGDMRRSLFNRWTTIMASKAAAKTARKPAKPATRKAGKSALNAELNAPTVIRSFVVLSRFVATVATQKPASRAPDVATVATYPPEFVPTTEAEMAECLRDPVWRICSGQLMVVQSPDRRDTTPCGASGNGGPQHF